MARKQEARSGSTATGKRMRTEHEEQVMLIKMLDLYKQTIPEAQLLFAIPNGGKRTIGTARKLKAEGVKAGIPDLFLPVARGRYHGMFIEMKREKVGCTTAAQERMIEALQTQDYAAVVCHGCNDALLSIQNYLKQPTPPRHSHESRNPEIL